ncbi:MAG TPA: FtsX-like permease family protein, partial [Acidobacteriota bacterium]|nr:FtsX-like permease family protein [Acidobacteriota bacterium]
VILGKQLAEDLNVRVGEVLQIVTPGDKGDLTPVGILPRSFTLKVVGLFESGLYEYDSAWGYIALETAQELTGEAQSARVIQIMLDDIYQVKEVAAAIQIIAGPEFVTNDWQELNQPAFAALNLQRLGFAVGISLIILVAALNIVTTLIMLVVEKKRDIAILTAMGATSGDILVIFMIQGVVIGAVGTLVGGMCGAVTAIVGDKYRLIQLDPRTYSISYVPFRFSASDTVLVLLIAMGISFFATLYPAWQASRLDPVEGIRQG